MIASFALVGCKADSAAITAAAETTAATTAAAEVVASDKIKIRFLLCGSQGDTFATVVFNGAETAGKLFGVDLELVWGDGWAAEPYIQQFREAVSTPGIQGISFTGSHGEDPASPIVEIAKKNGIEIEWWNNDAPNLRKKFGGGFIGAIAEDMGRDLAEYTIKKYGFKEGDRAIVLAPFADTPTSAIREEASSQAFEAAGMIVNRVSISPETFSSPELLTPIVTASFLANPETKVILLPGGQSLGSASLYMEALNKKPGEVIVIGFDLSKQVINNFRAGYVQVAADQQPYLQGFLPVQSLYQTIKYGFAPLYVNTGSGLVTEDNWETVAEYAELGIR